MMSMDNFVSFAEIIVRKTLFLKFSYKILIKENEQNLNIDKKV